jgi:hypothetical protein
LSNGNGTFTSAGNFVTWANGPSSVATGDFNRDGKLDLAVTNLDSNQLSVLYGLGGGKMSSPTTYPTGKSPYSVVVGDYNRDGLADLATCNSVSQDVTVVYGLASGGFSSSTSYPSGGMSIAMTTTDFNGDGFLDLAVSNFQESTACVLLGQGNGKFDAPLKIGVAPGPTDVIVADINRDGKPDMVTADAISNNTAIIINNSAWPTAIAMAGNFTNPASPASGQVRIIATMAPGNVTSGSIKLYRDGVAYAASQLQGNSITWTVNYSDAVGHSFVAVFEGTTGFWASTSAEALIVNKSQIGTPSQGVSLTPTPTPTPGRPGRPVRPTPVKPIRPARPVRPAPPRRKTR